MSRRPFCILLMLVLACAACTGSSETSEDADGTSEDADGNDTGSPGVAADGDDGADLPPFYAAFTQLCESGEGFDGVATYTAGPGPHPIAVFEELESGSYSSTKAELPDGWLIDRDALTTTDADLALFQKVELVACVEIAQKTDSGSDCEFRLGEEFLSLDAMDVLFDLSIYEAATGELVRSMPIRSRVRECPRLLLVEEGQSEYLVGPTADDYEELLWPTVEPR